MNKKSRSYMYDIFIITFLILFIHVSVIYSQDTKGFVYTQTDYERSTSTKFWNPKSIQSIVISDEKGKQVGKISWKDGIITFDGKVDDSAKIFFEYLIKSYIFPCIGQKENESR